MYDNCLVSVIIPVYNVSNYLERCLQSVISQSHKYLEIILVNDGSTDNSGSICDDYADIDSRITVIHQANQGVSAARNTALGMASGEFVIFLDSDDYLCHDSIRNRLKAMHDPDDLVMGRFRQIDESGDCIAESRKEQHPVISRIAFLQELFNEEADGYQGFLADKLFRTDIIRDHAIAFECDIKINEDRLFVFEYTLHCKQVNYISEILYFYCMRSESATAKIKSGVTPAELSALLSFTKMRNLSKEAAPQIYPLICSRSFECGLALYRRTDGQAAEARKKLKIFMKDNLMACLFCREITLIRKIKLLGHYILKV